MGLNVGELAPQMLKAAMGVLAGKAPELLDYGKTEFEKIAQRIIFIEEKASQGELKPEVAQNLLGMQLNSTKSLLATLEGLSTIEIEEAINAALDVVKSAVNTAVGFALII
jgi:hypothetical protein